LKTTVRLAAARVLLAVGSGRATLSDELERARADFRDERDRGLLLQITANTLRWRNMLDELIRQCSDRPLQEIHEAALTVLRIAAFELRFHTAVPEHAILNEAVEAVRGLRQNRAAGFVNAVLRTMTRTKGKLVLPPRPAGTDVSASNRDAWIRYLSITLSHPAWLVTRYLDRVGPEAAEKWCEYNLSLPEVTVRLAASIPKKKVDEVVTALNSLGAVESKVVPGAWRLPPGVLTGETEELLRPFVAIQDEGSQLVAHAAAAQPGERVLDLCAAPGGKSAMFSRAVRPGGVVISCDTRPRRLRVLQETLDRDNLPHRVVRLDATEPLPFEPIFDRVVVDAPCSGLGTLRRDPDVKWSRDEASLARFAAIQRALIDRAAEAVRPGGTLVYATCSSEPEENADVVAAFLADHPSFQQPAPAISTRPDRDALDAFFVAVLVRRESA
jgi:16S rRNA (cytosine967-C5)-methyltransferase